MKWPFKQVVYLIAFMVVAGCHSIDLPGVQCKQENDTSSYSSTIKVSADMVETYLKAFKGVAATKVTDVTVDPVMNGSDTVMYLVNYPEGGWELLSADARLPKVLVKCDDGNVTSDQLFSSPVDGQLYVNLSDFISDIQDNPFMEISCGNDDWSDLELMSIDPSLDADDLPGIGWLHIGTDIVRDTLTQNHLLKTKWGQGAPWNSKTPYTDSTKRFHCSTGCVMVAAAQVLYYMHEKTGMPKKAYGDSRVDKFIPDTLNYIILMSNDLLLYSPTYLEAVWDLMPTYAGCEGATPVTYGAVSTLMVQLGSYMNAWYRKGGITSCYIDRIPNCFSSKFGIDCACVPYNPDLLYGQIMVNHMPVIVNMFGEGGGHAAVVDGMKEITTYTRYTYLRTGVSETIYKYEYDEGAKSYLITVNWGWDGAYDNRWYNPYVVYWGSLDLYTSSTNMVLGFNVI